MAAPLAKTWKFLLSQVFLEVSSPFPKRGYRLTWKGPQGSVKLVKFPKPLKVHNRRQASLLSAQRNLRPFSPLKFGRKKDRTKWLILSHFKAHLLNHSGQDTSLVPAPSSACQRGEPPLCLPPRWVSWHPELLPHHSVPRHGSPSPPALSLAPITRDYPQVSYQLWGGLIYSLISGRETGSWRSDLGWLRQKKIERDFQGIWQSSASGQHNARWNSTLPNGQ